MYSPQMIANDLTLISYHGEPLKNEKGLYRSSRKSWATHFHADALAVVLHKGHRDTLAEHREAMKDVVKRLLCVVRRGKVKIKFVLLESSGR